MVNKIYFCYERNYAKRWTPVCYFDDPPSDKPANENNVERSTVWNVPDELIINGEPQFAKLMKKFEKPIDNE